MSKFEGGGRALRTLYGALPRRRQREAWFTVALMLVGALVEVLSVGAVLPFLSVMTNPSATRKLPLVGQWLGDLPQGPRLVATVAITFIVLNLLSGILRLVLARVSQALAFNAAYDLTVSAFNRLIAQPYAYYIRNNSGEIVARFEKIHAITFTVLLAGVQALVSSVIAVILIAFLFALDPAVALAATIVLVGAYILTSLMVRRTLARNSEVIAFAWKDRVRRVQAALGGIRDILIDSSQGVFASEFQASADRLRKAQARNTFIGISPKIIIETIGMMLIAGLDWFLAGRPGGVSAAIPVLGTLALGAQRLLPLLQQAYVGWSQVLGSQQNLMDAAGLLELPELRPIADGAAASLPFAHSLTLKVERFGYDPARPVLRDIALEIRKGERIGIVGKTGSGKSTLMDLLLGLLAPDQGELLVDGVSLSGDMLRQWQRQIAHVPQALYLSDDTVAANIAFGQSKADVDMARVQAAAQSAGIAAFIETLPNGYLSHVGERGIRFSGGQRQRIAIARALYKKAKVLVLDEATSALDTETETAVMHAISNLDPDITVVLIAHRLSTLAGCDRIIRLKDGRIDSIVRSADELA